jgi:hypothetical protein
LVLLHFSALLYPSVLAVIFIAVTFAKHPDMRSSIARELRDLFARLGV